MAFSAPGGEVQPNAVRVTLTASQQFPGSVGKNWFVGQPWQMSEVVGSLRVRDRIGGPQRRFSGVSRRASGQPFYGWSAIAISPLPRPARFSGLTHAIGKRVETRCVDE